MLKHSLPTILMLGLGGCGAASSDGFLSDHNLCNADLSTYSDAAALGEVDRAVTAVGGDGAATFGQRMTNFTEATDLYGIAVRVKTPKPLTANLELELWAKLDKELTYGQPISTVTPEGDQGVILAKAFVTPEMLPIGEETWVQAPLEEMTSVFASGRYWLMYKPATGDAPLVSTTAGSGLATYDGNTLTWSISVAEKTYYQVIPCQ